MVELAATVPGREREAAPHGAMEIPDFEVVPRAGLVIVAVAAVLLIVAIAMNKRWPLMFLHVAGGAAWTIIDLFLGFVLGPIMGRKLGAS